MKKYKSKLQNESFIEKNDKLSINSFFYLNTIRVIIYNNSCFIREIFTLKNKIILFLLNIFLVSFSIIIMLGCNEGTNYTLIEKPTSFSFKIIEPTNNQKVDKLTNVNIRGTCDSLAFTKDIFVYPLVKAPGGHIYPYYRFSINTDHTWDSFVYLGNDSNKSGDIFDISFCAVFKKDTILFENAHVPDRSKIKDIGDNIPGFCTPLGRLTLIIK